MGATHKGTCQVCGKVQRLPNGRLAEHGYTVFGCYNHVCPGSGQLPLEQDRTILDSVIEKLSRYADQQDKKAEQLKTGALEPEYMLKVRKKGPAWDGPVFEQIKVSREELSISQITQLTEQQTLKASINAKNARMFVSQMEGLADETHGESLAPIPASEHPGNLL